MAVFTSIDAPALRELMRDYSLGEVRDFRGIPSGIENSNFFLSTSAGEFVLTVFEKLRAEELPFYLTLMHHLAAAGVPAPDPVERRDGTLFGMYRGKPLAIVTRLPGETVLAPNAAQCAALGAMLGRIHAAGADLALAQPNLRSLPWWEEVAPSLAPFLTDTQQKLLDAELAHQRAFFASSDYARLPGGPCHGDLFRDNALFAVPHTSAPVVSGIFDFYFAGCDKFAFDLAVVVNDWCVDLDSGELDPERAQALTVAYESIRPLQPAERSHWRDMLRAAALRFWISRLYDHFLPRDATMLQAHDPGRFERTLRHRIDAADLTPMLGPAPHAPLSPPS